MSCGYKEEIKHKFSALIKKIYTREIHKSQRSTKWCTAGEIFYFVAVKYL